MEQQWWGQKAAPLDRVAAAAAEARQGQLTKPPGSLGMLERVAVRLAAMQGCEIPAIERPAITIFAADHGVVVHGVSAFPQSVTVEMVRNFASGGAAISVLAAEHGAVLEVVNVGTMTPVEALPGVVDQRIAAGTRSFVSESAMDAEQFQRAMDAGRQALQRAKDAACDLYIGGEMGIGNTTTAAAIAAALLQLPGSRISGAGTGLDAAGIAKKGELIQQALDHHAAHLADPLEVLRRLGGFEVVALCGSYIAAAQQGLPILVDGFISSVAALAAVRIQPAVREWMLFAHQSAEQGHQSVLEALEAEPLLALGMRLGEGSGAAVAFPLIRQACLLHRQMATFAEAGVTEG